ncbi:2,3-diaminopropionate biosynthesis protein SbnB [Streptomyces albofaciens JCM 4342]|uniref:2,3-diaminopropionate biosynthesis protein SbnB n=1 Tax=Streptomyces albofaciens TaxID=66866 RepID=UPI00123BB1B3|nr:2,3-diaminopropionate biosynthesis protein SbnB [Streptomyces albofaciens]KAA6212549.1 2,3-diaminopropionate biosynthesis protein SbnB [Streptomyces albofaciens JCM 4342]
MTGTPTTGAGNAPGTPDRPGAVPPFAAVSGAQVQRVLRGRERQLVRLVEDTYRLHGDGHTLNPPSCFLRFPDRPDSRIIALPASLGGPRPVDGLKWISSFPRNVAAGIPRASAVLILNDPATGYPYACLESSVISATRTAASAAAAADRLSRGRPRPRRAGFFGAGLIARYVHTFLTATGWRFEATGVYDVSAESADGFRTYLERQGEPDADHTGTAPGGRITLHTDPERLIRTSDLVVFATVAARPHVVDPAWFAHHPLVLHISLRDLAPEIVLASANFVDDVEHCLKADTSPHLAEQRTGRRDFIDGTLADVLAGRVRVPEDRTVIFSPFGLGVLDLAVGDFVHGEIARSGELHVIDDFFHELRRYG